MNFVPVITHAIAILLGWLLVSFASIPEPGREPSTGDSTDRRSPTFRSGRDDRHHSPSSLLAAQANTPMDPALRAALKRRILMDWATTDPDGLLRYLEHRPWLSSYMDTYGRVENLPRRSENENPAHKALEILARTRPTDLLAYAKREGCSMAIYALCEHGDPRIVLDLLLSLPPENIYPGHLELVFERGCNLDPDFHQRFDVIGNSDSRLKVFEQTASALLAARRNDALFTWLAKHEDILSEELTLGAVASQMVRNKSDVGILARLPESARPEAIRRTLGALANTSHRHRSIDEDHHRASLTTFLQNGWLAGNEHLAAAVITEFYRPPSVDRSAIREATAWKDWALDLPKDSKWDSLRHTAIRRWALTEPGHWNSIDDLPTKNLRNVAYAAVVHTLDLELDGERIPWILHQITDHALRNAALEVVNARMEEDPVDPDAPLAIDPFRPIAE